MGRPKFIVTIKSYDSKHSVNHTTNITKLPTLDDVNDEKLDHTGLD
jgi:hypothetical protein